MEDYDLQEFLEIRARVQIAMERLGVGWRSERVQRWLAAVGEREGRRIWCGAQLPVAAYRALANTLEKEHERGITPGSN